jgi:hypothetical protein
MYVCLNNKQIKLIKKKLYNLIFYEINRNILKFNTQSSQYAVYIGFKPKAVP